MARRKRLTFDPAPVEQTPNPEPGLEVKAFLRPGGGFGAKPPIAQVAAETSAQAALGELSAAMNAARAEGRLVLRLPLAEIEVDYLVRDRIGLDEDELEGLIASIREHGQRTPAEVTELAPGRYGLISGWRRIQALSRLFSTTGEARFGQVLALVRQPDSAADAYVAMVEENEIRLGLSYYERARIAARAVEQGVFDSDKQALQRLFSNASRARRSKIGSFLTLWRHLDGSLRFPTAIPERLGLALEKALDAASPDQIAALTADLRDHPAQDSAAEQARLARFAEARDDGRAATSSEGKTLAKTPDHAGGRKAADIAQDKPAATARPPGPQEPPAAPIRHEIRPGVFLDVGGGWLKPVLTLSGPGVGPDFREALERWLADPG